jgi:predicted metal-binding membrane protein
MIWRFSETAAVARRMSPAQLAVLLGGPTAIAVGCGIYLTFMISDMSIIPGMTSMMMKPQLFDLVQLFGLFLMWAVMMAAMMLPTALPTILAYARMQSTTRPPQQGGLSVTVFSGGYVLAWAGFSLGAALLQAGLVNLALLSPMMMKVGPGPLAASILIGAGLYQFSPLKQSCLRYCRTPMSFLLTEWREGNWGALVMGLRHGLFCVGCCWALMGLLFVAGVMNTGWILAITFYVLFEKVSPASHTISKFVGAGMIGWGVWILL